MDDLRRSPPPFPPLAVRERGNYISVREKADPQGGRGTLNRPKVVEMPRLGQQRLQTRLGYEATPSSEVWAFHAPYAMQLQVNRLSEDRAANCVAVALLDGDNRHVAPLVSTARGVGLPVTIPPGDYRIIASLGIPEEVVVEIEVNAAPPVGLHSRLVVQAGGRGVLLSTTRRSLRALSTVVAGGRGRLVIGGRSLAATAVVAVGGRLALRQPLLTGRADQGLVGSGTLTAAEVSAVQGRAASAAGGRALLRPVVWRNEPQAFWRARRSGAVLEFNRAYFSTDVPLQRQQLLEAGL